MSHDAYTRAIVIVIITTALISAAGIARFRRYYGPPFASHTHEEEE